MNAISHSLHAETSAPEITLQLLDPRDEGALDRIAAHADGCAHLGLLANARFQLDYLLGNLDYLSPSAYKLKALLVFQAGEPAGLLMLEERSGPKGLGDVAGFVSHPATLGNCGLLVPDHFAQPIAEVLEQYLRSAKPRIAGLSLEGTLVECPFHQSLKAAFSSWTLSAQAPRVFHRIDLTAFASFDDYLASLSRQFRKTLRKGERTLPDGSFIPAHSDHNWGFDDLRALDKKTWRAREKEGDIPEQLIAFCEQLAAQPPKDSKPVLSALLSGQSPVAFLVTLDVNDSLLCLKNNYDPAFASHAPGLTLLLAAFKDGWARGLRQIELMTSNDYVAKFANAQRAISCDLLIAPGLRGQAYMLAKTTFKGARSLAKRPRA